ncbi:hypothetical protein J2P12_03960, partial [Candidatus Bathyarchaeota archaeon]|nr:hypothetical protein [Candidatus Bathyarchaeota archaeon]
MKKAFQSVILIILSIQVLSLLLDSQLPSIRRVSGQGDFTAWPLGGPATMSAGTNSTGLVFVQGSGGFDTLVTFAGAVSPAISNSPVISFNPTTFGVSNLGSADTYMTVSTWSNTPARSYNYTVTATGGGVTHTYNGTIMVVPFSLTLSGTTLKLLQTYNQNAYVTITSIGGFAGNIALSITSPPSGPSISVSPTSISLGSGQKAGAAIAFVTTS